MLGVLHGVFGVRAVEVKPKPLYRWYQFPNGKSMWLFEGERYADGSKYRLPTAGEIIWLSNQ